MNPDTALSILDQATDPRRTGQLSRGDFVAVEQSLRVLKEFIAAHRADSCGNTGTPVHSDAAQTP